MKRPFKPVSLFVAGVVAGATVFAVVPAGAAPPKLPAGTTVTAEQYNALVDSVAALEAAVEKHHPGSFPASAPTPTPTPTPTPAQVAPTGVPGNWQVAFQDEFNGTAIDTSKWYVHDVKNMNGVRAEADNVTVVNGEARLQRSAPGVGAMLTSDTVDGVGKANGFELGTNMVTEARIFFPGNGTDLYNWSAWWATSDPWASGGEHDIAEQLDGGDLTINYHYGAYPNVTHANQRPNPAGYWGGAFHTYTLHRKATSADVYWDGKLVKSYPTKDDGSGETLILNAGGGSPQMLGLPGALRVDYVRAWRPAS